MASPLDHDMFSPLVYCRILFLFYSFYSSSTEIKQKEAVFSLINPSQFLLLFPNSDSNRLKKQEHLTSRRILELVPFRID